MIGDAFGVLAHLGLARDLRNARGDTVKARKKYQDLLTLSKDADSEIPTLKKAKASMRNCSDFGPQSSKQMAA